MLRSDVFSSTSEIQIGSFDVRVPAAGAALSRPSRAARQVGVCRTSLIDASLGAGPEDHASSSNGVAGKIEAD